MNTFNPQKIIHGTPVPLNATVHSPDVLATQMALAPPRSGYADVSSLPPRPPAQRPANYPPLAVPAPSTYSRFKAGLPNHNPRPHITRSPVGKGPYQG